MEIVAERMDKTTRCGVELPEAEWLRYLTIRRPLFRRYLVVISQLFNIKVITNGLLIRIEIPNLLKKRDNYTSDLEETSKKLPSIEVEVEVEVEKKKTKTNAAPENSFPEKKEKPKTSTGSQTQESAFTELKSSYPKKNGKFFEEQEVFRRFCLVPEDDWPLLIQAVKNYANSERVKDGIGIKDPKNFIGNQMNESSYWKEWIEPEKTEEMNETETLDEYRRIFSDADGTS